MSAPDTPLTLEQISDLALHVAQEFTRTVLAQGARGDKAKGTVIALYALASQSFTGIATLVGSEDAEMMGLELVKAVRDLECKPHPSQVRR